MNFYNYILAARPKTLIVSLSIWIVGLGFVFKTGYKLDLFLNSVILICMLCLQIAVNYFNDALDFRNKKDTSQRIGPARMVQIGFISESQMLKSALLVLSLAGILGFYLVLKGGILILVLGLSGMLLTYFYSAPPVSLADRGLSELFVFLFFGLFAVSGIFYINATNQEFLYTFNSSITKEMISSVIAGSQMGLLSISLLLINHLRDQKEDAQSGKKTWVVRKGRKWGVAEWVLSVILSYILGVYWFVFENNLFSFLFPLMTLPLYVFIFFKITNEKSNPKYNFYLALTSLGQFLFSIALVLSWLCL